MSSLKREPGTLLKQKQLTSDMTACTHAPLACIPLTVLYDYFTVVSYHYTFIHTHFLICEK